MKLLNFIEDVFREHHENRPVEYFFEDLPTSDYNELVKTIHEQYSFPNSYHYNHLVKISDM